MSGDAIKWARKQSLPPAEFAALLLLATKADRKGKSFPKVKSIAHCIDSSPRYVRKLLDKLEQRGLITSEERFAETGRQTTNFYTVNVSEEKGNGGDDDW